MLRVPPSLAALPRRSSLFDQHSCQLIVMWRLCSFLRSFSLNRGNNKPNNK